MYPYFQVTCPSKERTLTTKDRENFCKETLATVKKHGIPAVVDFCGVSETVCPHHSIEVVRDKLLKPWWFRLFVNPEVRSGVKAFLVTALLIGLPSPSFGVAFFSALSIPVAVFCFNKMDIGLLTAASIVFNAVRNFLDENQSLKPVGKG